MWKLPISRRRAHNLIHRNKSKCSVVSHHTQRTILTSRITFGKESDAVNISDHKASIRVSDLSQRTYGIMLELVRSV
jgi:hypothetical protein